MPIHITALVNIYESDDMEEPPGSDRKLKVLSHWSDSSRIVIELPDARRTRVTVLASDLSAAITDATHTGSRL